MEYERPSQLPAFDESESSPSIGHELDKSPPRLARIRRWMGFSAMSDTKIRPKSRGGKKAKERNGQIVRGSDGSPVTADSNFDPEGESIGVNGPISRKTAKVLKTILEKNGYSEDDIEFYTDIAQHGIPWTIRSEAMEQPLGISLDED